MRIYRIWFKLLNVHKESIIEVDVEVRGIEMKRLKIEKNIGFE